MLQCSSNSSSLDKMKFLREKKGPPPLLKPIIFLFFSLSSSQKLTLKPTANELILASPVPADDADLFSSNPHPRGLLLLAS
jgi:hypothetical protein